jgi:hypothetical protein
LIPEGDRPMAEAILGEWNGTVMDLVLILKR